MKRVYLKDRYNWVAIQKMYDSGLSLTDIASTKIISAGALLRGRKAGFIKFETNPSILGKRYRHKRPKQLTEQHKERISKTISEKSKKGEWHCSFKKNKEI